MPKKSKKPKKKTKSKPQKKVIVKKIPAKVGAKSSGANITQVVAQGTGTGGVGSRGGEGAYRRRRSQAEIAQARERQARQILGIPEGQRIQLTGRAGMGTRQPTTQPNSIKQPQGGFTGGVQGYGIQETKEDKKESKLEKRIVAMGDRIANLEAQENNAVRNNENMFLENQPRIAPQEEVRTAEQILRDFRPEAERIIGRQQALRQSQARARRGARRARQAREYTPIQTDAERERDARLDREDKERKAEELRQQRAEQQAQQDKISQRRKQMIKEGQRAEASSNVRSILGDVVESAMAASDATKEQQRLQKQREAQARETQLQTKEAQQERARALEQQKILDKERREAEAKQRASQIMADAIQERKDQLKEKESKRQQRREARRQALFGEREDVERELSEVRQKRREARRQALFGDVNPFEKKLQEQIKIEEERGLRPDEVEEIVVTIPAQPQPQPPDPSTLPIPQFVKDAKPSGALELEDVEQTGTPDNPIILPLESSTDEDDFEEFTPEDRPLPPPPDPTERPLPRPPDKPLPALNQQTQTTTETSSRESNTEIDPQAFVEINRLRNKSSE